MRWWLLLALFSSPALAQGGVSYPPGGADPAAQAAAAQALSAAQAAQSAATAAQTTANAAATPASVTSAITASIPAPCTAPLADTYTGSAGSGAACMARPDATRPTQVQSIRSTTDIAGNFTVTWPVAFATAPTYAHAEILGGTAPYQCDVIIVSTTGASGKCYQLMATTLPTVLTGLYGLVISPFATANSLTVMVVGRL